MDQISKKTDKALNGLSEKIGAAVAKIEEGEAEKEEAWNEVKDIFAEHGLEAGPKARFIAKDGFTIKLTKRAGRDKLNQDLLWLRLVEEKGIYVAKAIWDYITTPIVDTAKLEAAVIDGSITEELLKPCITTGEGSEPRIREEWTKEDRERAVVFGIK